MNKRDIEKSIYRTVELANKIFNIDLDPCVEYFSNNKNYGTALYDSNFLKMKIRINEKLCTKLPNHFVEETISHEVAHLVTFLIYPNSRCHGSEWKRICNILGGSAKSKKLLPVEYIHLLEDEHESV